MKMDHPMTVFTEVYSFNYERGPSVDLEISGDQQQVILSVRIGDRICSILLEAKRAHELAAVLMKVIDTSEIE
jgi:hypothetical protein